MNDRSLTDRYGLHLLGVLAAGLVLWQALAWWRQPPAVEFDNLRYLQLLTTAVSSRKPEMVDKVEQAIDARSKAGEMSDGERSHFDAIIRTARSGEWEQADRAAYEFAVAQLNRRRDRPASNQHDHEHDHSH